ncbi:hypothetical protein H8F24_03650 [Synechococcus sp. CBW1002]|uniref:hypothetical protein n=1 Tax=unclassified Synechococcus TaxID=2626047 RepID=UPI0018CD6D14|nr:MULTISPECIES: hypothetical protein [unclassified Synechococcus]QPN60537.1 hypothetical protein H8F24_03650 [Synechococcus sp. CBW1002]QPN67753.1 hypothetical protein H8F26_06305 [Synechococcus sp. CBW1006]
MVQPCLDLCCRDQRRPSSSSQEGVSCGVLLVPRPSLLHAALRDGALRDGAVLRLAPALLVLVMGRLRVMDMTL